MNDLAYWNAKFVHMAKEIDQIVEDDIQLEWSYYGIQNFKFRKWKIGYPNSNHILHVPIPYKFIMYYMI